MYENLRPALAQWCTTWAESITLRLIGPIDCPTVRSVRPPMLGRALPGLF